MPLAIQHKILAALGCALLVLLGVAGTTHLSLEHLALMVGRVERTYAAIASLEQVAAHVSEAETASRGYYLTGDPEYVDGFRSSERALQATLRTVDTLVTSEGGQRERLVALRPLLDRRLALMRRTIALRGRGGLAAALPLIRTGQGRAMTDSIRAALSVIEGAERALLAHRTEEERAWARNVRIAVTTGFLIALVIGIAAMVVVRRDLAARAVRAEALARAKEAAEAASRAKSEFLARMSHELRTPLNSVIGFANYLIARNDGALAADGQRIYLERIRDNGMHLLLMIDDLLDVARIEAGRVTVRPGPVDVGALAESVVGSFEEEARRRGLALVLERPERVAEMRTDPARFRQVLVNLVGNAIKFTPAGTVTVRVVAGDGDGRPERIDVVDTGIGVPPERREAIFEAFEQGDGSTDRTHGGTGLGLAISRSLCELLGHRLELASEVGAGSTFSIVLGDGPPAAPATPATRMNEL